MGAGSGTEAGEAAAPADASGDPAAGGPRVSVVVPVLNEAATLPALLARLAELRGDPEVVVVDGGSLDAGPEIVAGHPLGARLVRSQPGRARQCNLGAAEATGDVVLFLHADTILPPNAVLDVARGCRDPAVVGGNFVLRFDGSDRFSRVMTRWYAIQRRAGVFYGDSAIWVRRDAFERMGGFARLPIMEDYELVRRLRKLGRTTCLPGPALTSARRWRALGWRRTLTAWLVIRWLFIAGVPAERLVRLYPTAR